VHEPRHDSTCEEAVLRWLLAESVRRAGVAQGLVAILPQQSMAREYELSRLSIGLADLVRRLDEARDLLQHIRSAELLSLVTDLQARTWIAAGLLEARARLASGTEPDPERWADQAASLERAYGPSLFR
jgi:hypothetical protein